MLRGDGRGPGATAYFSEGRHITCETGFAIPGPGVEVIMEVGRGPAAPVRDFSVIIHTQAGRVGASGLLTLANGTIGPRSPAQTSRSLRSLAHYEAIVFFYLEITEKKSL